MDNVNIFYDNDGNICGFSSRLSKEWESYNHASISLELKNKITSGDWARFKVDVDSKEFKLYSTVEEKQHTDPFKNKLIDIPRTFNVERYDLKVVIKSIDNRPHIVVNSSFDDDRKFEIYLTKQGDPNFLYQMFECETNKEVIFEIDQIDYKKLFAGNISFYYYKIFNSAGYQIK